MPKWIRVRDVTTNHQFDIDPAATRPGLEPLNDPRWPDLDGPGERPRPGLAHVSKDGTFAPPPAPDSGGAVEPGGGPPADGDTVRPGRRGRGTPADQPADMSD
jgi:hypothetical protein